MEKRLKKYTSIPQHLYVNRNADEQLKRIVDEMQRPGYVLVARQMGKTNLLFNAKRTLENNDRLFVYVDLSNVFKYERECYRNIIDNIIEPNENLFEAVEPDINILRDKKLPPHKEYSKSLRIVLEHFQGDIVIVLDEIDALRTADYSDNIFAQIRSNYFSRTNFPVFEKLTYILSGVIEPTELIKDRNKSPFNIGDKIYLDDFSLDEHNVFIDKSELILSENVSNEIYHWTNGNPRLTFDICSSIESLIMEKEDITIETLNSLIKKKYLTSFDIAPIDHIRELVKTNKDVRNAVLSIQQSKGKDLSDELKKKLYLFGIINSKFDEETSIKNPIIKNSLSINWIKSIDKQTQSQFSYGLELMEQFEFHEAITILSEFISNSSPTKEQLEICHYNIGFAFYNTRNLKSAIEYFSKDYSINLYKENAKSLLGICKLGVGEKEKGVEILENILKQKTKDFAFRNAALNLAPIIATTDKPRAFEIYNELYESTFQNDDDATEDELNKIRTLSHYYKAELYSEDKDIANTLDSLKHALKYANSLDGLDIQYSIYNLSEEKDENLKSKIIDTIIDQELKFDTKHSYPISFSANHLYNYLDLYFSKSNTSQFERLLDYAYNNLFDKKIEKCQIVYTTSKHSAKSEDFLKYILEHKSSASDLTLLRVNRDLAFNSSGKSSDFFTYFYNYEKLFLKYDNVNGDDIYIYALAIKNYSDANKIKEGIELCKTIDSRLFDIEDEELIFETVIIYYWYSNLNFSLKKQKEAIFYANKTIQLIQDSKKERTSMIDEKGVKAIIEQMRQIKSSSISRKPMIIGKKYGRNERIKVQYLDGKIIENKYKKLEADIIAERCKII
tara:strand:+ start:680 stop:3217 length:2538 start_codon:yes stop_codon:yes gene_type:complete